MSAPPVLASSLNFLRRLIQHARQRLAEYLRDARPLPPRTARLDRFLYGLAQPVIGARFVARDRQLVKSALLPVVLLALFCAAVTLLRRPASAWNFLLRFYAVFAVLAPVPSIVFAHHYARLAATARQKLGLGDCQPRLEGLGRAIRRAVYQAILVAVAALPVLGLLRLIPGFGGLAALVSALWALHWVIIGAFDDARVLEPGETLADVEAQNAAAPKAWFVRCFLWLAHRLPVIGGPLRWFSRRCDRLSLEWREEMEIAENHPVLVAGFGLTTATLLATPVLNLFFRPIIIVASVHLLGHISREETAKRESDQLQAGSTQEAEAPLALPAGFSGEPSRTRHA